jgi:hypothetical protein
MSENASVEGKASTDAMPPLLFPTDEEKILPKNETALKILQSVSSQNANSSEVMIVKLFHEVSPSPIWLKNINALI